MTNLLNIIMALSSVALIGVVLLQNQGSGIGEAFGGGGGANVYRSKRGVEKGLFFLTIVLAVLLVGSILVRLILA